MVKVLVKKLDPNVKLPSYKTEGSSGMDLMARIDETITIPPKKSKLIPTGLSVAIPNDCEIQKIYIREMFLVSTTRWSQEHPEVLLSFPKKNKRLTTNLRISEKEIARFDIKSAVYTWIHIIQPTVQKVSKIKGNKTS